MPDLVRSYRHAADGFARRLELVKDEQWTDPTPCSDWTVRELVAHVLDEQLWIPPLLAGETIADVGDRFAGDQLGADPHLAWSQAEAHALAALSRPGVGERVVHLSFGDTMASDYITQVAVDTLVHTWDLARAIGAEERLDPREAAAAIEALAPVVESFRAAGVFAPEIAVAADADAQTRLLGMLGRTA